MIPRIFIALVLLILAAMAVSHINFNDDAMALIAPAAGPEMPAADPNAPTPGGAFTMQDADGNSVTEATLVGQKHHLIFFGFSNCAEVCPAMLQTMAWVYDNLPETTRNNLQFVFVSIDPLRDDAAKLKEYVHTYNPTFKAWYGTQAQVDTMTAGYMAYASIPEGATASDPTWQAGHSSYLYLMGPDGKYIKHFSNHESATALRDQLADIVK